MILQALTTYYEAMLKKSIVAPPGWDGAFKVSFWLELNDSGELHPTSSTRGTTNSAARKPCSSLSR